MIKSILCFKLFPNSEGKPTPNVFASIVITSLFSPMCTPIITMTSLNCCKAFGDFTVLMKKINYFVF